MRLKFIRRDRGSFSGDLLLVLADCRPVRGEAVRGGAGNGCYGKYNMQPVLETKSPPRRLTFQINLQHLTCLSLFYCADR